MNNQSIFDTPERASEIASFVGFSARHFSRGFFVRLAHGLSAPKRHTHSLRPIRLTFTAPMDFSARRWERIRQRDGLLPE
jgi:hypothetical protein